MKITAKKSAFRAIGIDLSTKATGVVCLEENGTAVPTLLTEQEVKAPELTGLDRSQKIVVGVLELIHELKPDRIVVEGYSLNLKNASSVVPLVEIGGLLRFMLKLDRLAWYDPRATELKKFVTGAGNTPKDKLMMFVLKRWQHESKTNNTADAYGLACMGLASANRLPGITKEMRTIAGSLAIRTN